MKWEVVEDETVRDKTWHGIEGMNEYEVTEAEQIFSCCLNEGIMPDDIIAAIKKRVQFNTDRGINSPELARVWNRTYYRGIRREVLQAIWRRHRYSVIIDWGSIAVGDILAFLVIRDSQNPWYIFCLIAPVILNIVDFWRIKQHDRRAGL